MEIRVLNYFLTVITEGSINKAADVLHITQPTLSRQLSQLEYELGAKLFNRGARKITLTQEGALLRRRAEEILTLVDKTRTEITLQDEVVEGRIVIGSGELAAVEKLTEIIEKFREKYPLVGFDIFASKEELIKEKLENGLIDIGVMFERNDYKGFDYIRFEGNERWGVLMRSEDELAKKSYITKEDLNKSKIIMPNYGVAKKVLTDWFGDNISDVEISLTNNLSTNGVVMVKNGLGYAVVIEGTAKYFDSSIVTYRPFMPTIQETSIIAWKKNQAFNSAVMKFVEYLNEM